MKREKLTETFIMISNEKNMLASVVYTKIL